MNESNLAERLMRFTAEGDEYDNALVWFVGADADTEYTLILLSCIGRGPCKMPGGLCNCIGKIERCWPRGNLRNICGLELLALAAEFDDTYGSTVRHALARLALEQSDD